MRFEPTIPVFERAKIFHALDREVTVMGCKEIEKLIIRPKAKRGL
jgi:hypothetical protein